MTDQEVHAAFFGQQWLKCTLRLTSGDVVTTDHPDYSLMPREKNWVLYVKPGGEGLQFIPTTHIAAIELEREPASPGA